MFILSAEIRENVSTLKRKRMTKHVKAVLDEALDFWHKNMLPAHTKRVAYVKYPEGFQESKKKFKGAPLRVSGHFADHIESPSQRQRKGGSSTSRKIKITFGRPAKYTGENLAKQIRIMQYEWRKKFGKNISTKEAQAKVLARAGYGLKAKRTMLNSVGIVSNSEKRILSNKIIKPKLIELMNKPKPKRRKKIG